MTIHCTAVRPEHAGGLARLFEASQSPCFCRFWTFDGDDNAWQLRCATSPETNREELTSDVEVAAARGVVATLEGETVGWLKLAEASAVPKMFARRLYRAEPWFREARDGVYMVGCVLVHPSHRRVGVARALVHSASEIAKNYGARALEALPRRLEPPVRDDSMWNGPISAFEAAGFVRVAGVDGYPVLRREL